MTGIKAQWHLAEVVQAEDPFANVVYSSGVTLDLTASEEELAEQWVSLLKREERLAVKGLRCELKDGGQDCRTCPAATLDADEARSVLCRLGKDQAAVEARCLELRDERLEGLEELAAEVDLATELGHMPEELVELATSVGL